MSTLLPRGIAPMLATATRGDAGSRPGSLDGWYWDGSAPGKSRGWAEPWVTLPSAVDRSRCTVPDCDGASSFLSRQEEDALWQTFFMAAPARRRVFEPSSKRRKRASGPWPRDTA